MAVMILKAKYGQDYVPPPATGTVFTDVRPDVLRGGLDRAAGRGGHRRRAAATASTAPTVAVTRRQMAVFLVKATHNPGYVPPPAAACSPTPLANTYAPWIEKLAQRE